MAYLPAISLPSATFCFAFTDCGILPYSSAVTVRPPLFSFRIPGHITLTHIEPVRHGWIGVLSDVTASCNASLLACGQPPMRDLTATMRGLLREAIVEGTRWL